LLKRRGIKFDALVVSLDPARYALGDQSDLYAARRVSEWLGITLHEVLLSSRELIASVPLAVHASETRRASIIDVMAAMYHAARYLQARRIEVVYTGSGADDIFGGLSFQLRFTRLSRLHQKMREDIASELPVELAAMQKLFSDVGAIGVVNPYLSLPLLRFTLRCPPRQLIDRQRKMKVLLRTAFAEEIPSQFLWRDKAFTRVSVGLKPVLERRYGASPRRYYAIYEKWLQGLVSNG
jgi:asparagine synthase (glutamine-hydrolysing)